MHSEETSNNRVRSGPRKAQARAPRPIDLVPAAGARQGTADGVETTEAGLALPDPEDPERSPGVRPLSMRLPSTSRTPLPARSSTLDSVGSGGGLLSPLSDGRRTPSRTSTTTEAVLLSPIGSSSYA